MYSVKLVYVSKAIFGRAAAVTFYLKKRSRKVTLEQEIRHAPCI